MDLDIKDMEEMFIFKFIVSLVSKGVFIRQLLYLDVFYQYIYICLIIDYGVIGNMIRVLIVIGLNGKIFFINQFVY